MPFLPLRRALLAAACALPLVLVACGGGSDDIVSEFTPERIVAFGDAAADVGQRGGVRYSINGSGANWTQDMASRYGLSLAATAAGGTSYAIGSARVNTVPDATGNAATPTVAQQITNFLAAGGLRDGDLLVVNAGTADLIAETMAFVGGQSEEATIENVRTAGRELGAQVRRLVDSGATHVAVVGPYNLGRSPWASATDRAGFLERLSTEFNDALKVAIVDLGSTVLYIDAALYFNLVTANPVGYTFDDVTSVACNSVDPGAGIGIGAGQVSSALCNTGTVAIGSPGTALFADPVYMTPAGHNSFGNYAYDRLRERW